MNQSLRTPADKLLLAAIDCGHSITAERIVLIFDPLKPGENALNQLALRLSGAHAELAPSQQLIAWVSIDSAPKDGSTILVNDTSQSASPWAAAKWVSCEQWEGWAYEDEIQADGSPEGPRPTKWLRGL